MAVDRDLLVFGQIRDDLGLVVLAERAEEADRLRPVPDLAADGFRTIDDLVHALFDARQILGREGLVTREIVIEAVLDGGTDGHLGAGVELLDGLGQDMGGIVPDQLQRLRTLAGDDLDRGVFRDRQIEIAQLAVDLDSERRLGEAGADVTRDFFTRGRVIVFAHAPVGKRDPHHARGHRCLVHSSCRLMIAGGRSQEQHRHCSLDCPQ